MLVSTKIIVGFGSGNAFLEGERHTAELAHGKLKKQGIYTLFADKQNSKK